jgi:hypothetical protein
VTALTLVQVVFGVLIAGSVWHAVADFRKGAYDLAFVGGVLGFSLLCFLIIASAGV